MKICNIILAIALFAPGASYAQTPQTKASLQAEISSQLPNNTVGAITPAAVRGVLADMVVSWQQYTAVNPQSGTSYSVATSDYGKLVTFSNSGTVAVSLPAASSLGFTPFSFFATNSGIGTDTITPASGTIGGGPSLVLIGGQGAFIVSDGVNWQVFLGAGSSGGGGSPGGSSNAVQYKLGLSSFGGTNILNNSVVVTNGSGVPSESFTLPNGIMATTQTTGDASQLLATDQFVANALVGAGLVTSVFGRAGSVTAQSGDYLCSQITGGMCASNNLSELTNPALARTALGLGTFAVANTASPPSIGNVTPAAGAFTTLVTSGATNISAGPFQYLGNTMTLPNVAATLTYKSGTFTPGDCLIVASSGAGGPLGAIADSGVTGCGGGGGGGSASNSQIFKPGVCPTCYTPGSTTTLTLSSLPVAGSAVSVYEDGVSQPSDGTNTAPSQWKVDPATGIVTFTQPIQATTDVYVSWLSASVGGGSVTNVSVVTANGFAGTVATPTTTAAITLTTSITGFLQGNGSAISAATTTGSGNTLVLASSPVISSPTLSGTVAGANTIPLSILAQAGANTVLGNWTSGTANVTANSPVSCPDSAGNHTNWVNGTGFTCGTTTSGITALTGDVTASGTGSVAATIAANAVTYAKFQQPTANSLVGNPTGSGANAQNITLGSTLNFSGTTLNCTTATAVTGTSQLGCVKPDGTSIDIAAGVISVVGSPATSISASGGTTVTGGTNGNCLVITAGNVGNTSCGTATSIADAVTNVTGGVSGSLLSNSGGVLSHESQITLVQTAPFTKVMSVVQGAQFAGPMGFMLGAL